MITENKTHLTDRLGIEGLIELAKSRVIEAREVYRPVYMSGAFSGGGDSIAACLIASLCDGFRGMFHVNTGVGLCATEAYVESTCVEMGWELETFKAVEHLDGEGKVAPIDYFKIVERYGFPGPSQHGKMYTMLKQRQMRAWRKAHKKFRSRQNVMLISGARQQESKKRNDPNRVKPHAKIDGIAWVNPLYDASKLDCTRLREHFGVQKSSVVDLIHMSGECLCGAFGSPEELKELKLWFGNDMTIARLANLDESERAAGRPGWGCGGPMNKRNCPIKPSGPMCSACDAKHAANPLHEAYKRNGIQRKKDFAAVDRILNPDLINRVP